MATSQNKIRQRLRTELGLFAGLLFFGIAVMPLAIWFIGQTVFGAYGGEGYGDFFGTLTAKIRAFDFDAWFLVLSPWLAVMVLRLMAWGWRASGKV